MNNNRMSDDSNIGLPFTSISKENSPTPKTPNLDLSRENTPFLDEPDHLNNVLSKGNSNSEVSAEDGSVFKSLDFSKAQLKRLSEALPRVDSIKRKVTAKAVEKNWLSLDKETLNSFYELCNNSSNKVKEQLQNSSNRQAKLLETERVLLSHWTSETLPKSFFTRVKVSKLPLIKSLPIKTRESLDFSYRPLDVDQVEKRRAQLEENLQAELKELEKLEAYYTSAKKLLDLDQEYLVEFQKTRSETKSQLEQEIQESRDKHKLHKCKKSSNDVKLYNKQKPSANDVQVFNPEQDSEVRRALEKLNKNISTAGPSLHRLQGFTEHLKLIEQKLISQKFK